MAIEIPAGWDQWQVHCTKSIEARRAGKPRLVFVRAVTRDTAQQIARKISGLKVCLASPYWPPSDPKMGRFIHIVSDPNLKGSHAESRNDGPEPAGAGGAD